MSIVVIDYGVGNVKSIKNSFKVNGENVVLSNKKDDILKSKGIVLPGVGAFSKAMENLHNHNLYNVIVEFSKTNKPILGICLGMQMLMENSEEFGMTPGLGLIDGCVKKFPFKAEPNKKLPHIGWTNLNEVNQDWNHSILDGISNKLDFYFVHSYIVIPKNHDNILSNTFYHNIEFCSTIKKNNIYGCQFHPEKSSTKGLKIIKNFIKICNE